MGYAKQTGLLVLLFCLGALTICLVCAQEVNSDACSLPVRPLNVFCSGAVTDTGGILAVSQVKACSYYKDPRTGEGLICDSSGMTVLDVSIPPGGTQTVTYKGNLVSALPASGRTTVTYPTETGRCPLTGNCAVVTPIRIEITASDFLVVRQMTNTGIDVNFAQTAFHTDNFDTDDTAQQCQPLYAGGTKLDYDPGPPGGIDPNHDLKYLEGIPFHGYAAPPIEADTALLIRYAWVFSANNQFGGSACRQPLTPKVNQLDQGFGHCVIDYNGYQCTAINPRLDNPFLSLQIVQGYNFSYPTVLPPSPFATPNVLTPDDIEVNPWAKYADGLDYENNEDIGARWKTCLRVFTGGRLTNRAPGQVWAGTYITQRYIRNDQYFYQWACPRSNNVNSFLDRDCAPQNVIRDPNVYKISNARPVMIGVGKYFAPSRWLTPLPAVSGDWVEDKKMPWCELGPRRMGQEAVGGPDDDDCLGSASSIIPKDDEDGQSSTSTNPQGSVKPLVPVAVCQGQDPTFFSTFSVVVQFASAISSSIFGYSQQALQKKVQNGDVIYCSTDRVGVYETASPFMPDWLANSLGAGRNLIHYIFGGNLFGDPVHRDTYSTADTMGTFGEPCRRWDILPGATIVAAFRVVMYNETDGSVIANTTVSNYANANLQAGEHVQNSANLDPSTNADTTRAANTNIRAPQSKLDASRLMFVTLVNIDSTTKTVAQDIPGSILYCNVTDRDTGLYQSATDPTFGTPMNPWSIYDSRECVQGQTSGNCRYAMAKDVCNASAKVPLPQCMAPRAPYPGAPYNYFGWVIYIPPERKRYLTRGCGGLAASSWMFNEKSTVAAICRSDRYTCVAGWAVGKDFLLDQRLLDTLNNTQVYTSVTGQVYIGSHAYELAIMDNLTVHNPAQIQTYYTLWSEITDPRAFLTASGRQRYLPPDFVTLQADGTLSNPNFFWDGPNMYQTGISSLNTNAAGRLQIGFSGMLTQVETTVSSGVFTIGPDTPLQCSVLVSGSGQLTVGVMNTGMLVGQYRVSGNCSNGVTIVPTVGTLSPGESSLFKVPVMQNGFTQIALTQNSQCFVLLDNPSVPNLRFDFLSDRTCLVLARQSPTGSAIVGNFTAAVCNNATSCPIAKADIYTTTASKQTFSVILVILSLVAIVLVYAFVGYLFKSLGGVDATKTTVTNVIKVGALLICM